MSNLLKKILAFFRNLFKKAKETAQETSKPVEATPVAPVPVASVVVPIKPAPVTETFAQWFMRVHPDLANQLVAYTMACGPFLANGMSYEAAFEAARKQPAGSPTPMPERTDYRVVPLTGDLLAARRAVKDTESYQKWVKMMEQAGYSERAILEYVQMYGGQGGSIGS